MKPFHEGTISPGDGQNNRPAAVCVVGKAPRELQTLSNWESSSKTDPADLLNDSDAQLFLYPTGKSGTWAEDPQFLELALLASIGRPGAFYLPDGSAVVPRQVLSNAVRHSMSCSTRTELTPQATELQSARLPANFDLRSIEAWQTRPRWIHSTWIPLRIKEAINRVIGRPAFDLSFYLNFQPSVLPLPLCTSISYVPRMDTSRKRIAIVTPHLGPGGAEAVILEVVKCLRRESYELLLIVTQSKDDRWLPTWKRWVDHVFDIGQVLSHKHIPSAVLSIVTKWQCSAVIIQNALAAYSALPALKRQRPLIKVVDVVHAAGDSWDLSRCTQMVSACIDTRIAISQKVKNRLLETGTKESQIKLIRNGVDLTRFVYSPLRSSLEKDARHRILFAGRLERAKRPELLVDIAAALLRRGKVGEFRFVVAGDGPSGAALQARVRRAGLAQNFDFLGYIEDLAPVFQDSDILVITSSIEGIPLVLLEAFATGRPVVASDVGAIGEVLGPEHGFLVPRGREEIAKFAEAIEVLLAQPASRIEMGRAARRKVEHAYDLKISRAAYQKILEG